MSLSPHTKRTLLRCLLVVIVLAVGGKQVVLALGVSIEGHDGDVGACGDRLHRAAFVAQAQKDIARGSKDLRALAGHQLGLGMIGSPILQRVLTSIR